jgi:hypothetical protein
MHYLHSLCIAYWGCVFFVWRRRHHGRRSTTKVTCVWNATPALVHLFRKAQSVHGSKHRHTRIAAILFGRAYFFRFLIIRDSMWLFVSLSAWELFAETLIYAMSAAVSTIYYIRLTFCTHRIALGVAWCRHWFYLLYSRVLEDSYIKIKQRGWYTNFTNMHLITFYTLFI